MPRETVNQAYRVTERERGEGEKRERQVTNGTSNPTPVYTHDPSLG